MGSLHSKQGRHGTSCILVFLIRCTPLGTNEEFFYSRLVAYTHYFMSREFSDDERHEL